MCIIWLYQEILAQEGKGTNNFLFVCFSNFLEIYIPEQKIIHVSPHQCKQPLFQNNRSIKLTFSNDGLPFEAGFRILASPHPTILKFAQSWTLPNPNPVLLPHIEKPTLKPVEGIRTCHPEICHCSILIILNWRHLRNRCWKGSLMSSFLPKSRSQNFP